MINLQSPLHPPPPLPQKYLPGIAVRLWRNASNLRGFDGLGRTRRVAAEHGLERCSRHARVPQQMGLGRTGGLPAECPQPRRKSDCIHRLGKTCAAALAGNQPQPSRRFGQSSPLSFGCVSRIFGQQAVQQNQRAFGLLGNVAHRLEWLPLRHERDGVPFDCPGGG